MSYELFVVRKLPQALSSEQFDYYYKLMKEGDLDARNMLITHNLRLVSNEVTNKYNKNLNEFKELMSIGIMGLIKAVDTYNNDKGSFANYAITCIDNEIKSSFKKGRKLRTNTISLNIPINEKGNVERLDLMEDESARVVENYERYLIIEIIKDLVSELDERERFVLSHRYGFDDVEIKTQIELAKILKTSRSSVAMIEYRALEKIKKRLEKLGYIDRNINSQKRTRKPSNIISQDKCI